MKVLDVVNLKDGTTGTILEIYPDGGLLLELVDSKGETIDMMANRTIEDVSEIVYTA